MRRRRRWRRRRARLLRRRRPRRLSRPQRIPGHTPGRARKVRPGLRRQQQPQQQHHQTATATVKHGNYRRYGTRTVKYSPSQATTQQTPRGDDRPETRTTASATATAITQPWSRQPQPQPPSPSPKVQLRPCHRLAFPLHAASRGISSGVSSYLVAQAAGAVATAATTTAIRR